MKKIITYSATIIIILIVAAIFVFSFLNGNTNTIANNNVNQSTNVTFVVHIGPSDCPALQYCSWTIVVYYLETGAEIGSQAYSYGTSTYNFNFGYIDDSKTVCARMDLNGTCHYPLTVTPACVQGPFVNGKTYNLYPPISCD